MPRHVLLAGVFAALSLAPSAIAQVVQDDFSNGNFTDDPEWTGDVDRFVVVETDTLNWLRNDGLPENDTLHLSTASTVVSGYWRFRFRHEVSLSNVNGSRIYLVASSDDLKDDQFGYYIQFGMNTQNRVELWRQDGEPQNRVRLGESETGTLPGIENTVLIEVTRDAQARWTVLVDEEPVMWGITDATYLNSSALGVWVRHNATGRDRFFWTDFLADPDPGDISPPYPVSAIPAENGAVLYVQFDQAVDPQSIVPNAFTVEPEVGQPVTAVVTDTPSLVRLDFSPALQEGSYTLTVAGVADPVGNVQYGASIGFTVTHDFEPPNLVGATALDATTVRVFFDKPVFGCDSGLYDISPAIGQPAGIVCDDLETYDLLLGQPLTPQQMYTVTATDVSDIAGNVQPETSAAFFFGDYDVPQHRDIVINEIMYAPSDTPSNEYVELFNRTADRVFDLSRLRLANATSPHRVITEQEVPVGPGDYVVLVRNPEAFEARWPDVPYFHVSGFPALLNGGDTPQLILDTGTIIDAVPYLPSWGGLGPALERRDPNGPSMVAANWGDSQHPSGGTPGEQNSIYEPDVYPPVPLEAIPSNDGLALVVRFDEPLNPETVGPGAFTIPDGPAVITASYDETDGFLVTLGLNPALEPGTYLLLVQGIEDLVGNVTDDSIPFEYDPDVDPPVVIEVRALDALHVLVRFDEPVDQVSAEDTDNYFVSDGIGTPQAATWEAGEPRVVHLLLPLALSGPAFYTMTVRNVEDVFGNAMGEQHVDFFYGEPQPPDIGEVVINEIMHSPTETASNEWVELHNPTEKVFDLAEFTLSDQATEVNITDLPYLLPPGGYAVLVRNAEAFEAAFPAVPYLPVSSFPALLNSGDAVVIRYVGGRSATTIDSVFYRPAWGGQGVSLERRNAEGPSHSPMNWASSLAPSGGTPGEPNSVAPDTFPPQPLTVEVAPNGRSLTVFFDEPLDSTTVVTGNFDLSGVGEPATVTYVEDEEFAAVLDLNQPLAGGEYTLTINGVSDLLGNTTDNTTISFDHVPNISPPTIAAVIALDELLVRVRFSEAVEQTSASDSTAYSISEGIGNPASVTYAPDNDPSEVDLTLGLALLEGVLYELTVAGVADLAGNVQTGTSAYFILGDGDTPEPGDLVINEIMFRPAEGGTEYVELLSTVDKIFDLSAFTLSDEGNPRAIAGAPVVLPPHGYLALARNLPALRQHFGDGGTAIQMSNLPQLRNAGDAVVLRYGSSTVDSLYYSSHWHRPELRDDRGIALERLDPILSSIDSGNWTSSLHPLGGTPGASNSVSIPPGEAPQEPGISVHPSPFDAQAGTVIRYRLGVEAGSVRIRVFDGAGRHVRTLEDARLGGSTIDGEVIWNGRDDRGESLRVGIYIILLDALDIAGGRTETYRAAVVLARQWQ